MRSHFCSKTVSNRTEFTAPCAEFYDRMVKKDPDELDTGKSAILNGYDIDDPKFTEKLTSWFSGESISDLCVYFK